VLGLRGANDEAAIAGRRPFLCFVDDVLVEGFFADEFLLEIVGALIGCEADEEGRVLFVGQEGLDAVLAHIGCDGQGVGAELFKEHARVLRGGIADIADFGIDEHGDMLGHVLDSGFERLPTLRAKGAVEGKIGLVAAGEVGCCIDDLLVEIQDGVGLVAHARGQFGRVGVEADAEQGIILLSCLV